MLMTMRWSANCSGQIRLPPVGYANAADFDTEQIAHAVELLEAITQKIQTDD
jgi:hypothetical protein